MKKRFKWSIPRLIALSFFIVIFTGSILLSLPIAQQPNASVNFFSNLFTSVSCVCVTGLWIEPVYKSYNGFGQVICMILMQVGGLGLMTIIAFILTYLGKKIDLHNKIAVSEGLNKSGIDNLKGFVSSIIKYTFVIELVGVILLSIVFVPDFGYRHGLFNALFVSISAFCNAGFDNFGASSLISYADNVIVNLTITSLIIFGGIGFAVWFDLRNNLCRLYRNSKFSIRRAFNHLTIHTRLVLTTTFYVIVIGTILGVVLEYGNPNSWGTKDLFSQIQQSYFQTVTMRTAGFSTVSFTALRPISNLIYLVTMFIGGSPGGTAGGLKTATVALIVLTIVHELRSQEHINYHFHTISREVVKKAFIIFVVFVFIFTLGVGLIVIFNPDVPLLHVAFETISALATVGVSMDLTPHLSTASQIVLMLLMFIGRVGPITLMLSLSTKKQTKQVTFAQGDILIG